MLLDNQAIGERIRAYRKLKRYSREGLAEILKIPVYHVSQLERGEIVFISEFIRISRELNMSLKQLADGDLDIRNDNKILFLLSEFTENEKESLITLMKRIKKIQ